ncbi:hypothetical protein DTO96_102247 [Ephemeroptericola cinctiostellae]|uniref:TelA-like protein n=1 Tax=Ephemeroptericola cinctiostellae TaxID=2268024 RepID=A0A345DDQ5_9BURK|nr:toxic anion resistance protein [Ephemeroptericola cinctiostellae]AXF86493.1 hypothetical protein DTO96_102247 [Ephemeroptericola cinctiostellae]
MEQEAALKPTESTVSTTQTPTSVAVHLPVEWAQKIPEVVQKFNIPSLVGTQIVTFGQEPVNEFSRHLDDMLEQITKADSPVLFELFRQVSKGVKDMDLPSLETEIRKKLEGGWLSRMARIIGLGSQAGRLESAADEVRGLLKSKASSLLDLIRPMETQVSIESNKLIGEVNRLAQQAAGYRNSILNLGVYVAAGREILHDAHTQLTHIEAQAHASQDPMQVRDAKDFRTKVELFENRILTLESAYAKAPVDLESIGIAQSAGLMTLADTISSSQVEFNDIKSALLRLNATFQIRSLQQLNTMRRELRADLQKYSLQQLETVAVDATRSAADAQLENAQLLLGVATTLGNISNKVDAERQKNVSKIASTRALLKQVQQTVATLNP